MRIAQVAPLWESVPPKLYGGTERIVSYLTEELVRQGHDVTLFASADSETTARLEALVPRALRLEPGLHDATAAHVMAVEAVAARRHEFDIVHFHVDHLHLPLFSRLDTPFVSTLHGRLDLPELKPLYARFPEAPLISISNHQRLPLAGAHWVATVYNGIPETHYDFHHGTGEYLAFLGRMSPEKGPDQAIEIARRAGMPIKLAAKVDPVDQEYFEQRVRPLLKEPGVEFIGEINDAEKNEFLGKAAALVFPIAWPEPFGLVMIEAMACGTPVIAYPLGSVPEIVEDGVNGFVVEGVDQAVAAVGRLAEIDRRRCREVFEARFSARRMAEDYVAVYRRLLAEGEARRPQPVAAGA